MDIDPCLKKGVFSEWGMKAPLEAKQKSFNDMKNAKKIFLFEESNKCK